MPQDSKVTSVVNVGDCVKALTERARTSGRRPIKLMIADAPYNIGMAYAGYKDSLSDVEYEAWTRKWLLAAWEALADDGSLWVFCPDEWASLTDVTCKALGMERRNWVVWFFTFGQKAQNRFTRSKVHLLYFAKDRKRFTFNAEAVAVPSARQLVYKDKRATPAGKPPDDTWVLLREQLESCGPDLDVWLESRVCGTFKERMPHSPNQLPVPLLERIVRACSNPGDLVADPFVGSGSSGVAAVRHGRHFLGYDLSAECVKKSRDRITQELIRCK